MIKKKEYPMCTILEAGRASPPVREVFKFNPVYGFIQSGFLLWPLTGSKKIN